jgi:hypothetical protein
MTECLGTTKVFAKVDLDNVSSVIYRESYLAFKKQNPY